MANLQEAFAVLEGVVVPSAKLGLERGPHWDEAGNELSHGARGHIVGREALALYPDIGDAAEAVGNVALQEPPLEGAPLSDFLRGAYSHKRFREAGYKIGTRGN